MRAFLREDARGLEDAFFDQVGLDVFFHERLEASKLASLHLNAKLASWKSCDQL